MLVATVGLPCPASAQTADTSLAKASEKAAEEDRTVGLELSVSDGTGLNTVGENYRNDLSLLVAPRWSLGRKYFSSSPIWRHLVLTGRFLASRALAGTDSSGFGSDAGGGPVEPCSDLTPSEQGGIINPSAVKRCHPQPGGRRIDYSDISIAAGLPRFHHFERLGLDTSATARFVVPISRQSRYQTLRFATGLTGGVSRGFLDDRLRVGYNLGFTKNFHEYSTAGLDPSSSSGSAGETGGNPASGLSGVGLSNLYSDPERVGAAGFSVSYSFSNSLTIAYQPAERWSVDLLYTWTDGFAYDHQCSATVSGYVVDTCATGQAVADASGTETGGQRHRKGQVFSTSLSYSWTDWLGFSLSWITWAPRLKPDGSFRQGFISTDYNAFTTVFLGTNISVEELAARWSKRRRGVD